VADEKLILLNNWFFFPNLSENIKTELVLAVPPVPINMTDF